MEDLTEEVKEEIINQPKKKGRPKGSKSKDPSKIKPSAFFLGKHPSVKKPSTFFTGKHPTSKRTKREITDGLKHPELGKKYKKLTTEDKENAIALLQKNNFDTNYVATVTGINKNTINYWLEEYKGVMRTTVLRPEQMQVMIAIDSMGEEYENQQEKFRKALHITKFSVVERMLQLIPTETNLRYLSEILEVINEIEKSDSSMIAQSLNGRKNGGTILQLIQNQIMTVSKGELNETN